MDTAAPGPNITLAEQIYLAQKETVQAHLQALEEIIRSELDHDPSTFEGNAFYRHQTFDLANELIPKQIQLFALGGQAPNKLCEIGVNAAHSALLFLLGRRAHGLSDKPVSLYLFDINEHVYTEPAVGYLRREFPEANIKFFEGDSTAELPTFVSCRAKEVGTFDLVHVDGGHEEPCIKSDLGCAQKLVRPGGFIIIDDTDDPIIDGYVSAALNTAGRYKEVVLYKELPMYPHRILQRIL